MDMLVQLGYGKCTFSSQSASYTCFKVSEPFQRVSAANSGKRTPGGVRPHPASANPQINGFMYAENVRHAPGTIIMLQVSMRSRGASIRDGAMFLRLRADGPIVTVKARLPTAPEGMLGDEFTLFAGSADVLTEAELSVFGLEVPRRFVSTFMDEEELEEIYTVNEVGGTTKPNFSAVVTSAGERKVITDAPVRRLRVRR